MKNVTITYHGHACFTLEADGFRTVLDPYEDGMIPGLPSLRLNAEAVLCSHGHGDHNAVSAVTVCPTEKTPPYRLESLETAHDDQGGALRGKNLVRIFDFDGFRVAHLGDLGTVPQGEILEKLQGLDCMLIPVGGTFTIDPAAAWETIEKTGPRVIIPMHYRTDTMGFDVLCHLEEFTKHFAPVNVCDNTAILNQNTPKQVLVVNYKP